MTAPQQKRVGRPTKAEQLARGITETDLKKALAMLKRVCGPLMESLITECENPELSLGARIKLKLDLIKLYESLLKTNKTLLSTYGDSEPQTSIDDDMPRPVFKLA